MKKTGLTCTAIFILLAHCFFAQDAGRKNVIKLNLLALGATNISGQYERALHKNFSIALQAGFIPSRGLPGVTPPDDFKDIKLSGVNITPELRFYPGAKVEKQAPHGFYLNLYFRYAKYDASGHFDYSDSSYYPVGPVISRSTPVSLTYSGVGLGLGIGYQWIIKNRISVDWWVVGFHYGTAKLDATVDATGLDKQEVKKQLDQTDVKVPGVEVTKSVTISGNDVLMSLGFPFVGLRTGFSLGICF